MPSSYIAVLLLSLLSCVTTCAGVLLAGVIRDNAKAIAVGIGFSTGIMLLVSGVELIPEADTEVGPFRTALTVILGALANFAAELDLGRVVRRFLPIDTAKPLAYFINETFADCHDEYRRIEARHGESPPLLITQGAR